MDTLFNASSGVFNYLYNKVTGEEETVRNTSGYRDVFTNGMRVNDLPTTNYEPLEDSLGTTRAMAEKVGVSFLISVSLNYLKIQ